jgi:hypothetical protein
MASRPGAAPGSPPTLTAVNITPLWARAGQTLTATPTGSGATSHTYQWTNGGTDIAGATGATYANDGTWGSNVISCKVVAVNAGGSSNGGVPLAAVAPATLAWVGFKALGGVSDTIAHDYDCGFPMFGQSIWLAVTWGSPAGNLTIESSGPTAAASHAYYKGTTGAVGNKTSYLYAFATSDQTITVTKTTTNYSLHTLFKSVGYSITPQGFTAAGVTGNNTVTSAPTVNVAANDAVFAFSEGYETLSNPSAMDFLDGANFQEQTGNNYCCAGSGIATATNAALASTFSTDTATSNKQACIFKAVPG